MGGKAPKTIFTNQDKAMVPPLRSQMLDTFQVLHTFHILQNAKRNLTVLFTHGFVRHLLFLFYQVDSEQDFDSAWNIMLSECFPDGGVTDHQWLEYFVKFLTQWSSIWVFNHYTPGMRSTQLVELCNSTIHGFLSAD
ncbi:Protein FAR-RED IMPAIRED RESPONSE 1 [Linum grandiflorum]